VLTAVELVEIEPEIIMVIGIPMAVVLTAVISRTVRLLPVDWVLKRRQVTDVVVIRALIRIFRTGAIIVVLESRLWVLKVLVVRALKWTKSGVG
jgi:hypothetical protein